MVIDEEDNATTLLIHRISSDDVYRRQEGRCKHKSISIMLVVVHFPQEIGFGFFAFPAQVDSRLV